MRILLRDTRTGKYVKGDGTWTGEPLEAHDFRSATEAVKSWAAGEVGFLELVFYFGDPKYDLSFPLGNSDVSNRENSGPSMPGSDVASKGKRRGGLARKSGRIAHGDLESGSRENGSGKHK